MSHTLKDRDSAWLKTGRQPDNIGPGMYEGAQKTANAWNQKRESKVSRRETAATASSTAARDNGTVATNFMNMQASAGLTSSVLGGGSTDSQGKRDSVIAFNSKLDRKGIFMANYNPGPGTYQNVQKTDAFRHEFVKSSDTKGGRGQLLSQDGMRKTGADGALDFNHDVYGNPSYTVKEGGTLKKKLQTYAATKTERESLLVSKERLAQVTAPGWYNVSDGFDEIAKRTDKEAGFSKFTAQQRLAKMGLLRPGPGGPLEESTMTGMQRDSLNRSGTAANTNYYTAPGQADYMLHERGMAGATPMGVAGGADLSLQPVGQDMMKRVRKTAKWSQLYQSGPSFPPKHKVLFINQDEQDADGDEAGAGGDAGDEVNRGEQKRGGLFAPQDLGTGQMHLLMGTTGHSTSNQLGVTVTGVDQTMNVKSHNGMHSPLPVGHELITTGGTHKPVQSELDGMPASHMKQLKKTSTADFTASPSQEVTSITQGGAVYSNAPGAKSKGLIHLTGSPGASRQMVEGLGTSDNNNSGDVQTASNIKVYQKQLAEVVKLDHSNIRASAEHQDTFRQQDSSQDAAQRAGGGAVISAEDQSQHMMNMGVDAGALSVPTGILPMLVGPDGNKLPPAQLYQQARAEPSIVGQTLQGSMDKQSVSVVTRAAAGGGVGEGGSHVHYGQGSAFAPDGRANTSGHTVQDSIGAGEGSAAPTIGGEYRGHAQDSNMTGSHQRGSSSPGHEADGLQELQIRRIKKSPRKQKNQTSPPRDDGTAIGPGAYEPATTLSKPQAPAYSWAASGTVRDETTIAQLQTQAKENPGPDRYNQQQHSIGMKLMRDVLDQETVLEDKLRGRDNFSKLVHRVSQKAKNDQEMKKERHVMRKKYMANKVQPGAHQNLYRDTDFRAEKKNDYLQFFGTTDVKLDDKNFVKSTNPAMGPGAYDIAAAYSGSIGGKADRRAFTANFVSTRKDILFTGNSNPGPQEYANTQAATCFKAKNWQTNIGAFGTTERKFATHSQEGAAKAGNPGPGSYSATSCFSKKKYKSAKVRGKAGIVRTSAPSASFASVTTRSFDPNLSKNERFHWPAAGQYDETRTLGGFSLQGGAPNNFLLLKYNKSAAPFQSTVPRFQTDVPKILENDLGPGEYRTNSNFDLALNKRNHADELYPGMKRKQQFSQVRREICEKKAASPKNFRIGREKDAPSVGTYNVDTSAFNKAHQGYNYRFY